MLSESDGIGSLLGRLMLGYPTPDPDLLLSERCHRWLTSRLLRLLGRWRNIHCAQILGMRRSPERQLLLVKRTRLLDCHTLLHGELALALLNIVNMRHV